MENEIIRTFQTRSCIKVRIEDYANGSIIFVYPNTDWLIKHNTIGCNYNKTIYTYIEEIFIKEEYRNQRLGNKIMNYFIDLCKEMRFKEIYLHAYHDETNLDDLIKIYSTFGFKVIKENPLSCEMLLTLN